LQIKAAVLRRPGAPRPYAQSRPLSIETVALAPPGAGEVLVRIAAAGLCHSDLSIVNGDRLRQMPVILGHEAAGVVETVGQGVTDLAAGDHVILVFVPSCGHCAMCGAGRPALCEPAFASNYAGTLFSGGRRLAEGAINHFMGLSAFASHAVVSRHSLIKIDRSVPLDAAALFSCAVLTGVGAVINTAGVKPGASVGVVGLGGVGLNAVMGAVVAGASRIVALDANPAKLDLARQLGATEALAVGPDTVKQVRELTQGGVDWAIETAGAVPALELALAVTRRGGETISAGLPRHDASMTVNPSLFVVEERALKGSYMGSAVPSRDLPRYLDLYRRGRLPVDRLLSATLPLERINEGFDALADGSAVRQVIAF